MSFLFVITNLAGGGAEKVIITLADGLIRQGVAARIVLLENIIEHHIPNGLPVHHLTKSAPKGFIGKRILAAKLKNYVKKTSLPSEITISSLPFANEISVLSKIKNLWLRIDNNLSSEIKELSKSNPKKAARRLKRYQKLYSQKNIIAVSSGVRLDLVRNISKRSNILAIPNPYDFSEIKILSTERSHRPVVPYVIHVGRFNRQKRHDVLLDAWKMLETDRILILLTKDHTELQKMIDERNLTNQVIIAGFQANPYPWISGADLLVLSSDHEGLGGVIIEALVCGTPVVSTNCPSGPSEILSDYPNSLVPVGDPKMLSETIASNLSNPPALDLKHLEKYNVKNVLSEYAELKKHHKEN